MHHNSTILILGSTGFLGHHVVKKLREYKDGAQYNIEILTPTHSELELLNAVDVACYLDDNRPDIIIHLAAQCGGIGANREKPGEFLYNNLIMTVNLIDQCAKLLPKCKFVGIGTVCSYPKHTPVPFKEENLYDGYPEETNAPYGIAKRVQLEMLKAYRTQYGLNGIYLIPVNMAGAYDNFNDDSSHVIPAMLKKFHKAKTEHLSSVLLWGDGSASREFLNVRDCAQAILDATLKYNSPDPVNIGTGNEITIRELAEKIKEMVGYEGKIEWDKSKPNGQPRRCLNTDRAHVGFGFIAQIGLDDTLREAYDWYCNEYLD